MEIHLYLGTTDFVLHTEEPLHLQQWDAKFLVPVLPVSDRVEVVIEQVEALPIPNGPSYYVQRTQVWDTQDGQFRLYAEPQKRVPCILSHHQKECPIRLLVQSQAWQQRKQSFRPWFHIHLEQLLLERNALVLHSASIIHKGKAILFTAPSGTGKTTQTDLWHQYRDNVTDLNGDRTLLQKTDNGWFACGFPVFGSTVRCEQAAAPIAAIVIIRQGSQNKITELSPMEKVAWLYSESTVMSMTHCNVNATVDLLEDLARNVAILRLDCTISEHAVDTLDAYLNRDI